MTYMFAILLIIVLVAAYGLFQLIYQQRTHEELEVERRQRFMKRSERI
jgi:Ca2+/H+ antiporter